jgi:hypothetical protein
MRIRPAILLLMLVAPLLPGCGYIAGRAAEKAADRSLRPLLLGPRDAEHAGAGGARLVRDAGSLWRRSVWDARGEPLDPGRYRSGETVRVEWSLPFQIRGGVEAMIGVASAGCEPDREFPAMRWLMRGADGGAVAGEAWLVERGQLDGADPTPGRQSLGLLPAEALASRVGLRGERRINWVLIVPGPGAYELVQGWEGMDPRDALSRRPCVDAWTAVPLTLALEATSAPRSAVASRAAPARPRGTSDEGVSLVPLGGLAQTRAASGAEIRATSAESLARDLGLLGLVEADLARLHQAALRWELEGADARREASHEIAALNDLRRDRLQDASRISTRDRDAFCRFSARPDVSQRALAAWGGEPTVPAAMRGAC